MEVCGYCLSQFFLFNVCKGGFPGIILHNLSQRTRLLQLQGAHKGKVSGLCFAAEDRLLSCGMDRNIKLWDIKPSASGESSEVRSSLSSGLGLSENFSQAPQPVAVFPGKSAFKYNF